MKLSSCFLLGGIAFSPALAASTTMAAGKPIGFIDGGSYFGGLRYRLENVEQDGLSNSAKASTVRANLGIKTGTYHHFSGLIEGQVVQHLGQDNFNDGVNGKMTFPTVSDADNAEINQAWFNWQGVDQLELKLGRQIINHENQRFIGSVDWRQNDQIFDSFTARYTGLTNTTLDYGYVWNVNRIFGDDNPLGDLNTTSHLFRASHKFSDLLQLGAYGYWLEFDQQPNSSSQTYGLRATGKGKINQSWEYGYEIDVAQQRDYGNSPLNYQEEYIHVAPTITVNGITVTAGYEKLSGDGTAAFQTPLATLHKFNGWADKFLTTPAKGLEDRYLQASYTLGDTGFGFTGTTLTAAYHDYAADQAGDFGNEVNLSAAKSIPLDKDGFFNAFNIMAKYADYHAEDAPYTDTQKLWLQLGLSF